MKTGIFVGVVSVCAWAAGCASRWERLDTASLPSATMAGEAAALVLLDETAVRFSTDPRTKRPVADVTHHVRGQILRDGDNGLGRVNVYYHAPFSTVTSFEARTIASDGSTSHEWQRKDAADVMSYPDWALYSDARALHLEIASATVGTVVEYRYTVHHTDPRRFNFAQQFGGSLPARLVRLTVSAPAGWRVDSLARRLDAPIDWAPTVDESQGERRQIWERRDLTPLPNERWAPSLPRRVPTVQVRLARWTEGDASREAFRDAREMSAFLSDYLHVAGAQPTPAEREIAARALDGVPDDPAAKARRLYAWTRDHILYCAIEIGEGGWIPHPAHEVAKLQYGDCKDKANLLRSLLSAAGVGSRLAEVYSHDGFPLPFGLPSLAGNFNHTILIVDVPEGPVVVDPTSRAAPFGELPLGDQEAELLPVAVGGASLVRAPASTAETNSGVEEDELTLRPRGDADGDFHLSLRGSLATALRETLLKGGAKERSTALGRWLDLKGAVVGRFDLDGLNPTEAPTPLVATGRLTLAHAGNGQLVRLSDLVDAWAPQLPGGPRTEPVVFHQRRHLRQQLIVHLPGEVSTLPAPAVINSPLGSYRLSWSSEGRTLHVERELILSERIVPPEKYQELQRFFDAIVTAETRAATLRAPESAGP